MDSYTAVIFADDLFPGQPESSEKSYIAFAGIHGKPLLDWVISSIRASPYIQQIVVIGPEFIDELLCSRYIDSDHLTYGIF